MSTLIRSTSHVGAVVQQVALLVMPHGLQAQARCNARLAVSQDGVRRGDRQEAAAALSAAGSMTSRDRRYVAVSG